MSEDLCRPRIEALAEKLRGLRSRHAELTAAMDDEELTAPSSDELEAMRTTVQHAIEHGPNTLRKARCGGSDREREGHLADLPASAWRGS